MSEKMPNAAELRRIQQENLTDEQITKDREREETYLAGRKHGHEEAAEIMESATPQERGNLDNKRWLDERNEKLAKIILENGLSKEAENALMQHEVSYNPDNGFFSAETAIPEKIMIELIDKLPKIMTLDVGENGAINLNVARKFWQKFPDKSIYPYGNFDGQNLLDELDEKMTRWGESPKKVLEFVKEQILKENKK